MAFGSDYIDSVDASSNSGEQAFQIVFRHALSQTPQRIFTLFLVVPLPSQQILSHESLLSPLAFLLPHAKFLTIQDAEVLYIVAFHSAGHGSIWNFFVVYITLADGVFMWSIFLSGRKILAHQGHQKPLYEGFIIFLSVGDSY
ncbi:hypothetical protein RchiOBHm_Chr5g0003081 [Rosa chinensis]|uniref:Uncharacterized protein n=1 Tax=Rosa chinensis TaxID=74649 RepID=A0A2P6Q2P3_ROSCH|nr:hypothetical protein RchiOBHm_Chr5g0003081 [Rosa chinensis]